MVGAFLRNAEAYEIVVVIRLETGRMFVVHQSIGRLNLAAGDREEDGRVSGGIPTHGNPVKWRVQTVVCPGLENAKDQKHDK